jgi:hypothetical protein
MKGAPRSATGGLRSVSAISVTSLLTIASAKKDCGADPFPSVRGLESAAHFRVVSSARRYLERVDAVAVCLDQSVRGALDVRVVECREHEPQR